MDLVNRFPGAKAALVQTWSLPSMSDLRRPVSLIKCDNISVSTCIRVELGVIFKSLSVFTAVKGVMFVSGLTDPK